MRSRSLPVTARHAVPKLLLTVGLLATASIGFAGGLYGLTLLMHAGTFGGLIVNIAWLWEEYDA